MCRLAVIFNSNIFDRKGLFNSVINRVSYLKKISTFDIDVYLIQYYYPFYFRVFKKNNPSSNIKPSKLIVDNIEINILWNKFSVIDYFLVYILKKKPFFFQDFIRMHISKFKMYDLLSVHSTYSGIFSYYINKKYKTPYYITWHGSDIHTFPFMSPELKKMTKSIIENAEGNFYVSKSLENCSKKISSKQNSNVLYNGVSPIFKKFSLEEKIGYRKKYGVYDRKIVAFVGNLVGVKNVLSLPDIFSQVNKKYSDSVIFWIIGDGKLYNNLYEKIVDSEIKCKFWKNQPLDIMPILMNCIDVLVLPSLNEGLPLVVLEALKCGVNVVGSNRGGIKEILNPDDSFDINNLFIDKISDRIVYYLSHNIDQKLSDEFDWEKSALKESSIYSISLGRNI